MVILRRRTWAGDPWLMWRRVQQACTSSPAGGVLRDAETASTWRWREKQQHGQRVRSALRDVEATRNDPCRCTCARRHGLMRDMVTARIQVRHDYEGASSSSRLRTRAGHRYYRPKTRWEGVASGSVRRQGRDGSRLRAGRIACRMTAWGCPRDMLGPGMRSSRLRPYAEIGVTLRLGHTDVAGEFGLVAAADVAAWALSTR